MKQWLFNQAGCRVAYATRQDIFLPQDHLVATMHSNQLVDLAGDPIGTFYGGGLFDTGDKLLAVADMQLLSPNMPVPFIWSNTDVQHWLQQLSQVNHQWRTAV